MQSPAHCQQGFSNSSGYTNPFAAALTPYQTAMFLQQMGTPIRSPLASMLHYGNTPQTAFRAPRTTPARTERPTNISVSDRGPKTQLREDLRYATKDELINLLCKLSELSHDAASFIDCQAQLWQMRTGSDSLLPPRLDDVTPVKQLVRDHATDAVSPQTPYELMQAEQEVPPERRQFCAEKHPCVFHYGVCRNPRSCLFAESPCNLCMAFVRGDCPNGRKCTLVHRLPDDSSPQLRHLFDVKHSA